MALSHGSQIKCHSTYFLNMLETQFQTHVKIIRSDGGGEFANHLLKNYFASIGILHQLSCPGTP